MFTPETATVALAVAGVDDDRALAAGVRGGVVTGARGEVDVTDAGLAAGHRHARGRDPTTTEAEVLLDRDGEGVRVTDLVRAGGGDADPGVNPGLDVRDRVAAVAVGRDPDVHTGDGDRGAGVGGALADGGGVDDDQALAAPGRGRGGTR